MTNYTNLPQPSAIQDSSASTLKIFDAYTNAPVNIDASTYDAMVGFFEERGFEKDSATSMAYVIIKQSVIDKINPFKLIDTLKGINNVQLSALITEILNYNRFKTSKLGSGSTFAPLPEVARNIVA
jgi:hypothetical protein